jgi:hypothetical protein
MKIHLVALMSYLWGAIVCWLCVGCSSAAVDRTIAAIDPYQTCLVAALLSPRTADLAANAGMTPEAWSESVCRIADVLVTVAESIANSACTVPPRTASVAGAPSWP